MPLASITVSVPPSASVVTAAEVRAHARVDSTHEDSYITALVKVAERSIEDHTGLALLTQTRISLHRRVRVGVLEPAPSPVQSATWARYTSETATEAVTCRLTSGPPSFWYPPDDGFNYERTDGSPTWSCTAVCGWSAAADVPAPLRHAILMLCGHLYDNRDIATEKSVTEIPFTISRLLAPYAIHP